MAFLIAFFIFAASIIVCLLTGQTMAYAMVVGYIVFFLAALTRCSAKEIFKVTWAGLRDARMVVLVLMLIGIVTAAWRMSGIIAFFVFYGLKAITPPLFILVCFLLSGLLSYALGTCVGVSGTAGVILMAIAHSGGVDPLLAAGAILSGSYFGDRNAPTASAAHVVAMVTKTDLYQNVVRMWKSALVPLVLCLVVYATISWRYPLRQIDAHMQEGIQLDFAISIWLALPVLLMLVLPLLKVHVRYAMIASALTASLLAIFLQGFSLPEVLRVLVYGYHPGQAALGNIWDGGGLLSMLNIIIIVSISSTFAGILRIAGVLVELNKVVEASISKIGLTLSLLISSALAAAIFCAQISATIMTHTLFEGPYQKRGLGNKELSLDLSNSIILVADMVPWCLSSAVPLKLLGVGPEALTHTYLIFLIPLVYFFAKRFKPASFLAGN